MARHRCLNTRPWVDLYKVDLKSSTTATIGNSADASNPSFRRFAACTKWDLGRDRHAADSSFNDSNNQLKQLRILASVSPDIPWHVTAFHSADYKMTDPASTPAG